MRFRIWNNGGDSSGPHNWRYEEKYADALRPQTKLMNDQHLAELKKEWMLKHASRIPKNITAGGKAAQIAWQKLNEQKALEWAKKNEPRRYLNPLLRSMNGIPADTDLRHLGGHGGATAIMSSSWVGDAKVDTTGKRIWIDLGGKKYQYALNSPDALKNFGSAESIGRTIAQLRNSPPGTTINGLTKLAWGGKK